LNADQTKGGHPRIVFLSPKLLKELECYVRCGGTVGFGRTVIWKHHPSYS